MLETLVVAATIGDQIPAERELAKLFGVSAMTISRALKALQDEGYVERVPGKGTFVRSTSRQATAPPMERRGGPLAWQAPAATTDTVSVKPYTWIISNLAENIEQRQTDQWTHRAATSLERSLQAVGGRTLLIDFGVGMPLHPFRSVREAMDAGVNSVVLLPAIDQNASHTILMQQLMRVRMHQPERIAIVEISTGNYSHWPFDCVRYDSDWGVFRLVDHLVELGHKRIAFVGFEGQPWMARRRWAFENATEGAGVEKTYVVEGVTIPEPGSMSNLEWDTMATDVVKLFHSSPGWVEATAVIAINDMVAFAIADLCKKHGRALPSSLSIVGSDDVRQSAARGLTTVHAPIEEAAEMAANIICKRLQMPYTAGREEIVLNPSLVVRSSTCSLSQSSL
jgi:LacI family transcriptional regulator